MLPKAAQISLTQPLQSKLNHLQKKLHTQIHKQKQQLNQLVEEVDTLYERVEKSNEEYQRIGQESLDRIRQIEKKTIAWVEAQTQERRLREAEILIGFQDKAMALRKQIQKQKQTRKSLFTQLTSTLQHDLPTLLSQLTQASEHNTTQQVLCLQSCQELLSEGEKNLQNFAGEQSEKEEKIYGLIADLAKRVKAEIEEEREVCRQTYDQVLGYVEGVGWGGGR